MSELDVALARRFAEDVAALIGEPAPDPENPIAIAVSGGPDSMAMLALAMAAYSGAVVAATVDHGLRAEAADEAAMVASWCASVGVPHDILVVEDSLPAGANLHDWARERRYALLDRWTRESGAIAVATGHHADDQAETFLMRAARGAGLAGLAGVRPQVIVPGRMRVIRPLLRWRRAELRALVERRGIPFVDDPSNDDLRFDRAHFRTLLESTPELPAAALARSAAHLGEAERDLEAVADWVIRERRIAPFGYDVRDMPRGVKRLVARRIVAHFRRHKYIVSPAFTAASNIEPLLDALEAGKAATQAGVLVTPRADGWHFSEAPPRRHD